MNSYQYAVQELALSGAVGLGPCSKSTVYRWAREVNDILKTEKAEWRVKADVKNFALVAVPYETPAKTMDFEKFVEPEYDNAGPHDHDGFYDAVIDKLGGVDVVMRFVPFDETRLRESFERDEYFNDARTPIGGWDRAAENMKPFLASHKITSTALSQRVCLLKRAAERFVKGADAG